MKSIPYIHIRERVLGMLKNKDLCEDIISYVRNGYVRQTEDEDDTLEDFYSGAGFREYAKGLEGFTSNNSAGNDKVVHILLFVSTDGAPAFKSSNEGIWPIVAYVGNIPPHKRYHEEFVLPVSCIPGNPKDLESFLTPLFDELEVLEKGIEAELWDGSKANLYFHILHELSDLQARRKLCLLKGVNGYSPCAYCNIKGVRKKSGKTLYYPNFKMINKKKRTGEVYM